MPIIALEGPERPPVTGGAPTSLVVLLHGLGADGEDLIGLSEAWHSHLPDTHFCAPNAPHPCDMAPTGRQWFSLQTQDAGQVLSGIRDAAPSLEQFIDERLAALGLGDGKLALVGFSQGTMMSLHVGLRRPEPLAGILGYSGALVGAALLADELTSRPPVLLVHGDADEIVPVAAIHQAVNALGAAGVAAEWHVCPGLGHGIDPDGVALGGAFLASRLAADQASPRAG